MKRQRQRSAFQAAVATALAAGQVSPKPAGTSRSKYRNQRTQGYASKREYAYAAELLLRKTAINGDVLDWLEQVPVKLPGGIRYVVDFLVFKRDGSWEFVEVKGMVTDVWRIKMKLLEEARPELFKRLVVVK